MERWRSPQIRYFYEEYDERMRSGNGNSTLSRFSNTLIGCNARDLGHLDDILFVEIFGMLLGFFFFYQGYPQFSVRNLKFQISRECLQKSQFLAGNFKSSDFMIFWVLLISFRSKSKPTHLNIIKSFKRIRTQKT